MNMEFNVDKFVDYLTRYKTKLPQLYRWKAKIDKLETLGILNKGQIQEIEVISSPYERELILKRFIGQQMNDLQNVNEELFDKVCLWVIKDWGGIATSNDNDTKLLIQGFLKDRELGFNRVASYSKVASFMFPRDYIIYDSRVAYTLNWIILSERAGTKYFPMPEGRNSKMAAFDMSVLIRLHHASKYNPYEIEQLDNRKYISNLDKELFIPPREAFGKLNSLIKQVNQKLWEGEEEKQSHLYYTEMLLFSIADREVFSEITKKYGGS